ncbi:hypothetical protein GCM10010404_39250 [Nonomuraea africana]|uniref:Zf-HC2 domain-containing protein n=1 Tax=Nonomuraea africana TaxID=46171 RepID=A0ABR9KV73_9ACTN|nr:zf-HC2 domain-containing protein [Nonomuraea africana]MBE1565937.1 hypothetical protein [Nonomuraea africana]
MLHDPERDAAAYLADELSAWRRLWFERHMLDCHECWSEANTARQGRMLAESLRQVAPPSTRERIRSVADLAQAPDRRRWPSLILASAAAVAIAIVLALLPRLMEQQPASLVAAAQLLRSGAPTVQQQPGPPVPRIGEYAWRGTAQRALGEVTATVYSYSAPDGRRILVVASNRQFPRAVNAHDLKPAPSWMAEIGDVSLFCSDKGGTSWLTVAADDATALSAGHALGLR